MKPIYLFLCLGLGRLVFADVSITATLPANTFLQYEGIPLRMEITNRTGEDIRFGVEDAEDVIMLRMRDTRKGVIRCTNSRFLSEPWIIPDGETSVRTFVLLQLFRVTRAQSYRCLQDVQVGDEVYSGKPLMFNVATGNEYRSVKRRKTDRVFTLYGLNRNNGDELMLRVTNFNETMNLATYFLERHLRHYPPFINMNKEGEVATLHYVRPSLAVLCQFEPDGTPVGRTFYRVNPGTPIRLLEHPEEGFLVQGAQKMDSDVDADAGAATSEVRE
ncbi:MAG: hypothetical protein PF795_13060 [Kiritimatiellae bacterium]|jgi:hypothetical protein|nr:hypothetical protein [Kiritimatiellia bacterium]